MLNDIKIVGLVKALNYSRLMNDSFQGLEIKGNTRITLETWDFLFKGISKAKNFNSLSVAACNIDSNIFE